MILSVLVLAAVMLLGFVMIPFGFPGTLVMVCAAIGYKLLVPAGGLGWGTVAAVVILAGIAEGLEFVLTARVARRFGGSRRAGWGAIIGGMVGAFLGVPVPIVGSVLGAFAGAFVGALVGEFSRGSGGAVAAKVATGALIGRVAATFAKMAIGLVIAAWAVIAAMA